jgi:hypothetical protein
MHIISQLPIRFGENAMVNWKAPADVHRTSMQPVQFGKKLTGPRLVFSGALDECVRYIRDRSAASKPLYSIMVGPEAGVANTTLHCRDIEELGSPS